MSRPRLAALPHELRRIITTAIRHHSTTTTSSVSSSEVSHFSALASSWWDPHGPSRILHLMNPLRHQFISRCRNTSSPLTSTHPSTQSPSPSPSSPPHSSRTLKYLDIGCGGGIFAESAARLPNALSVTAIDPTPDVIAVAKGHMRRDPGLAQSGRLQYLNTSIEDLSLLETSAPHESTSTASSNASRTADSKGMDIVSIFEVIEHVNSPNAFLDQCMRHVKPGGWLIGSTIARTMTSYFTTKFMAEDVLRVVPRGTHDWNKYINAEEMRECVARKEGWGEWRVMGVLYVPGVGWREVSKGEEWGNYFFGIRRLQ
ncbi:Ubiquinone biosynthesis O-methyltransferase [Sphaceloma murrayae]|uniref:Ubiquinone biosynthesis O-methyltransferase, mitochondrial n=1 Tax=Sphaceloma murrayae TaxID=2082308 RepID=A0A2K1R1G7_9PEZI|nr:Ubiquinone biosynthesis O-methyltransferase [Sphaceloma murrayae]